MVVRYCKKKSIRLVFKELISTSTSTTNKNYKTESFIRRINLASRHRSRTRSTRGRLPSSASADPHRHPESRAVLAVARASATVIEPSAGTVTLVRRPRRVPRPQGPAPSSPSRVPPSSSPADPFSLGAAEPNEDGETPLVAAAAG